MVLRIYYGPTSVRTSLNTTLSCFHPFFNPTVFRFPRLSRFQKSYREDIDIDSCSDVPVVVVILYFVLRTFLLLIYYYNFSFLHEQIEVSDYRYTSHLHRIADREVNINSHCTRYASIREERQKRGEIGRGLLEGRDESWRI